MLDVICTACRIEYDTASFSYKSYINQRSVIEMQQRKQNAKIFCISFSGFRAMLVPPLAAKIYAIISNQYDFSRLLFGTTQENVRLGKNSVVTWNDNRETEKKLHRLVPSEYASITKGT